MNSFSLKTGLFLVLLTALSGSLNAQGFLIEAVDFPDVPACSEGTVHEVRVTNQFGQLVEDVVVVLTLPEEATLQNVVSGPLFVSSQTGNQVTLTGPTFLADEAELNFGYTLATSCAEALPTSVLVEVSCQQTTDLATEGTQELGFNFTAPSVLIMEVDNALVEAMPGQQYQRPLTLRNAGNEAVDEVRVAFTFANDFIEVVGVSAGTVMDGYVLLTAADFPNSALLPEEDFVLTLTEQMANCASEPIQYAAQWYCDDTLCQESFGSADTNPPPGEPNISFIGTSAVDPQSCEVPGQTSFLLQNAATEISPGASAAYDVKLSFGFTFPDNSNINTAKYSGEYFIVTQVDVDGVPYVLDNPVIDPEISNANAVYQVTLDQLPATSSAPVVVHWYYHHPNTDDPDCASMEDVTFHGKLNGQVNYTNKCGDEKPRVFAEGNGSFFQYRLVEEAVVAPTDVLEGGTFTFGVLEDFRIEGMACDNSQYRLRLEVPSGFVPQPGTAYAFFNETSISATWTQISLGVVEVNVSVPGAASAPLYGALEAGLDFTLDCAGDSSGGIDYMAYLECGDCATDAFTTKLACGTSLKPVADCGDCNGIRLSGFPDLHRASFGYTDEGMTTPITLADAQSQDTDHKAYVHDLVEISVPATVAGMSDVTSPQCVISHPALAGSHLLEPQTGFTVTFTPSGASAVTVPLDLPAIALESGLFEYRFDLTQALEDALGSGAALQIDDQVEVHGQFRVTDQFPFEDKTAFFEVPELRVRYEADGVLCNSRGLTLEVAYPNYVWLVDNDLEQLAGCATFDVGFNFRNRSLNNTPHFPGEFRPSFLAHEFSLFVPTGWAIAPGSERLQYLPMDECNLSELLEVPIGAPTEVVPETDGQTLRWVNDGSWPVKDDGCVYYGTHYRFVFQLMPLCDADLGDQLYMPATLEATTFAYAEEAFQSEVVETYGTFRPSEYWVETDFALATVVGTSQNGSSIAEWTIRLVNETGGNDVQNIWMAFPGLAEADLELIDVVNAFTGQPLDIFANDSTSWVFAQTIPAGGFLDYRVRANILACEDHSILVSAGKDCSALDGTFSPDINPCDPQFITLAYVQQPTGLQVNFSAPSSASSLCGVEFFEIDLNNALTGFAKDLRLTAVLPENVTWMQDSSLFQFPGPPELTDFPGPAVWGSLPDPLIAGDSLIWDMSALLPDSLQALGLPGAEFTESNAAHFVIGVRPECGFLQGDELRFFIDYYSSCGEPQETIASGVQAVFIDGINETLQTQFTLESEAIDVCSDTTEVIVRIDILAEDLLEESTVQQTFEFTHPVGFEVLENTFVNLYNADFLDDYALDLEVLDGEQFVAHFPLPEGMVSGDSLAFSFWVDRSTLPNGSYDLMLSGTSEINAFCDGTLCFVKRGLGEATTLFQESICVGNLPPVAVNDTLLMNPGGLETIDAGLNDFDPEGFLDLAFWEIITPPEHGGASLVDWGLLNYVADLGYTGQDSLQYRIRDDLGQLDSAWVMIQMFDPEVSCNQLFVNETDSAVIENCEGVYTYCMPMLYDALVDFNVYVDGETPDTIASCNTLFFTAYSFEGASFLNCLPEGQFPMVIEEWIIEGNAYGPATVNSMPDLAQWMNVIDPCGFWDVDADGRMRGGMVVLDYGPLTLTSPCLNVTESFVWNEYSVPQNPGLLIPPGCHEVVLESKDLWHCSDTISVCVECLGIVNTPPYTVENELPVDTFYTVTYQDMMIDYCFDFEDDENHLVGIQEVEETLPGTTVFYNPGDTCICYLPPPGYLGVDTVITHFCDNGDPVLCGDAVLIVDVLPLDELDNTPPYTVDFQGIPEDTLWVSVPINITTHYCLNFVDDEGHNVHVTDWVDFGADGSETDFPLLDGCMNYTPAPGYVGADILLVNYCDDGDPTLCNFTWIVLEIDPSIDPNDPPDVLDEDGLPTDTLYYTMFQNQILEECLTVVDDTLQTVGIEAVLSEGLGNLFTQSSDTCFQYVPPFDFLGTDTWQVNVCDNAPNPGCTQTTLIIDVLPVDCPPNFYDFANDTIHPVHPGCEGLYSYSIDFFLTEIDFEATTVNGDSANINVTQTADFMVYDVGAVLENTCGDDPIFPVEINGININNTQYSGGVVNNWNEFHASLNALDQYLTWSSPAQGVFRIPLNPDFNYGTLQLFTACAVEPQFVTATEAQVPLVGTLWLEPDSCYTISVRDLDTGCEYLKTVCPQCVSNTAPYTVDEEGNLDLDLELEAPAGTVIEYCFDFVDPEDNNVTVTGVSLSDASAFVNWEAGFTCFTFTPNADDEELVITIDYCDDGDPVLCTESTLTITFTNEQDNNLPPVANDDMGLADMGEQITVNILQNDYDPDGDPLTISVQQCGAGFGVVLDGMLYYQAPWDYCGPDSVCYTICDPAGLCDQAVVYVQVFPVDSDNDGLPDSQEGLGDSDGDGLVNSMDPDSDNDGMSDGFEAAMGNPDWDPCSDLPTDSDGDGDPDFEDADSDNDGIPDEVEGAEDCDGDGVPDYLDSDLCDPEDDPGPTSGLIIPQGFSPNDDGVGDTWIIQGLDALGVVEVHIFNRWGHEIYAQTEYLNDWDGYQDLYGIRHPDPLPAGTYYYILSGEGLVESEQGWVYLTR